MEDIEGLCPTHLDEIFSGTCIHIDARGTGVSWRCSIVVYREYGTIKLNLGPFLDV